MKKITKKSLDELARTMSVIPDPEMEDYWGMYDGDCFFRCIAYMESGGQFYDEPDAASYALSFWTDRIGCSVSAAINLAYNGAGMGNSDRAAYKEWAQSNSMYSVDRSLGWIAYFNYGNNQGHAIIVKSIDTANGTCEIFDPQNNTSSSNVPVNEITYWGY